jgi:hypothetical protein
MKPTLEPKLGQIIDDFVETQRRANRCEPGGQYVYITVRQAYMLNQISKVFNDPDSDEHDLVSAVDGALLTINMIVNELIEE